MDTSAVSKLVGQALPHLRWAMQLQDWSVEIGIGPLSGAAGKCDANPRYKRATIDIDPAEHDSPDDVLDTLRHELIHVQTADLKSVVVKYEALLSADDATRALLDEVYQDAEEAIRWRVEQMLDHGLGMDVKAMMRAAKRHQKKVNSCD